MVDGRRNLKWLMTDGTSVIFNKKNKVQVRGGGLRLPNILDQYNGEISVVKFRYGKL